LSATVEDKKSLRKKDKQAEIASQWKLMYWKFIKHKLAIIALPIVIILVLIAIFCEFLAPHTRDKRFTDYKEAPPNNIRFVDSTGKFHFIPFVYDLNRETNPVTFRRTFTIDPDSEKFKMGFFVRGEQYKLWGLIPGDIHFFGPKDPDAPYFVMGTDQLGRDIYTRTLFGTRVSLGFAGLGVLFTFIIGVTLGGISGYFGGVVDTIVQRIIDLLLCVPHIPLWMALAAALPRTWGPMQVYFGMLMVMSAISWTGLARVVRGKILSIREEDFTTAARLSGASDFRIIFKHMLPSFASYMIVHVTISIPATILGETALSFLGLGLQPPVVSWGVLLQDAQSIQALGLIPWLLMPCIFVILAVLSFNFMGDGLRDAADPYTR